MRKKTMAYTNLHGATEGAARMKAMLISVGTGSGVESAIALSINDRNPDRIAFLASGESRATIDAVAKELNHPELIRAADVAVTENPDNLDTCYNSAREAALRLLEAGAAPQECVADFTSGTKAMSVAVSLVAVQMGFQSLSYVGGGQRHPETGRVLKGTEQVVTVKPFQITYDRAAELAARLFNLFQFDACLQVVERMKRQFDETVIPKVLAIGRLAEFYQLWDRFEHAQAGKMVRHLKQDLTTLGVWNEDMQSLANLAGGLTADNRGDKKRKMPPHYVAADLLANADRRGKERKFDDAVARLYRLVEYLAQHVLESKHGQKSGSISKEWLKDNAPSKKYAEDSSNNEGNVKLGLQDCYSLLGDLGEPLGIKFKSNCKLRNLLQSRNNSILAHGLQPVPEEVFTALREETAKLCKDVFHKDCFDRALAICQFPELPVGLSKQDS